MPNKTEKNMEIKAKFAFSKEALKLIYDYSVDVPDEAPGLIQHPPQIGDLVYLASGYGPLPLQIYARDYNFADSSSPAVEYSLMPIAEFSYESRDTSLIELIRGRDRRPMAFQLPLQEDRARFFSAREKNDLLGPKRLSLTAIVKSESSKDDH